MNKNRSERKLFFIKNYRILFRSFIIISSLFWFAIGCSNPINDDTLSMTPECAIPEENKRSFWVYNLKNGSYDCIESELKREGSGAINGTSWSYKVYLDSDDSSVESTVSENILTEIKTKLDNIVSTTIGVFGAPPQPSSLRESAIIFFITDINDNQSGDSSVAGFFDPTNLSATLPGSNRVNMLVFDYLPLEDSEKFPDFHNTMAHELLHLIHYSYDQNEETWLDEGLAEMSSSINQDTTGRSLFDPDSDETCDTTTKTFYNCEIRSIYPISLQSWESIPEHYYKTALFFKYLCEKEGTNCKNTLYDIVSSANKGIYSIELALSLPESQTALGMNMSDFSSLKSNLTSSEYQNITVVFQSWLVAMSKVAYDNAMGSDSITVGDLDAKLKDHRYKTFSRSYPYWKYDVPATVDAIDYPSLPPFSADYFDWSFAGHGSNGFDGMDIITIDSDGTVDFSPASDSLNDFWGMEIVYNINPFYALSVSSDIVAKIRTSVSQDYSEGINNITGYLISIGNLPFNEISVRNLETGKTYALSGELVKDLAQNLGKQVSLTGFLSGELSRRNQEIFEVTGFDFL